MAKLLNAGADVDVLDNAGHTPLHSAVDETVAEVLLAAGGEPLYACASDGNTPMHAAARHENKEVLLLLLRAGGSKLLPNKVRILAIELPNVPLSTFFFLSQTPICPSARTHAPAPTYAAATPVVAADHATALQRRRDSVPTGQSETTNV